jgi:hypothetical protein
MSELKFPKMNHVDPQHCNFRQHEADLISRLAPEPHHESQMRVWLQPALEGFGVLGLIVAYVVLSVVYFSAPVASDT